MRARRSGKSPAACNSDLAATKTGNRGKKSLSEKQRMRSERGSILKGQGLAAADDMKAFYFVILRQEDCFATKTFIFNRFLRRSG